MKERVLLVLIWFYFIMLVLWRLNYYYGFLLPYSDLTVETIRAWYYSVKDFGPLLILSLLLVRVDVKKYKRELLVYLILMFIDVYYDINYLIFVKSRISHDIFNYIYILVLFTGILYSIIPNRKR